MEGGSIRRACRRWAAHLESEAGSDTTVSVPAPGTGIRDDADRRFSVTVLPTLLQLRWRRGLVIDRSDIARAGSAVAGSASGPLPLLVEVTALREVTWDAREAFVAYAHPAPIAILGSDAVDLVLTAFAVKSPTETRFFTDRDEAVRWLLPSERMRSPDMAHSEPWRP